MSRSPSDPETLLRKLDRMNPRFAAAILRKACGFEAAPGARAVTDWIAANRKSVDAAIAYSDRRLGRLDAPPL